MERTRPNWVTRCRRPAFGALFALAAIIALAAPSTANVDPPAIADVAVPPVTVPPLTLPPPTLPPDTTAPVTTPPVTSPPGTTPPVTSPPVTNLPSATAPPVTTPPVTIPPATVPRVTAPPATVPRVAAEPVAGATAAGTRTGPSASEPTNAESSVSSPATDPNGAAGAPATGHEASPLDGHGAVAAEVVAPLPLRLQHAATETARQLSFPIVLATAIATFLVVQHRMDAADPRVSGHGAVRDDDLVGFS